jgi:hypothetical protein
MAQDERAIRLWADHLAFSMIYRGGFYRLVHQPADHAKREASNDASNGAWSY